MITCDGTYMCKCFNSVCNEWGDGLENKIQLKCKREDEDLELRGEWRFAAMVLDRLCLWICVTLTVLSTTAIMFSAPTLADWYWWTRTVSLKQKWMSY